MKQPSNDVINDARVREILARAELVSEGITAKGGRIHLPGTASKQAKDGNAPRSAGTSLVAELRAELPASGGDPLERWLEKANDRLAMHTTGAPATEEGGDAYRRRLLAKENHGKPAAVLAHEERLSVQNVVALRQHHGYDGETGQPLPPNTAADPLVVQALAQIENVEAQVQGPGGEHAAATVGDLGVVSVARDLSTGGCPLCGGTTYRPDASSTFWICRTCGKDSDSPQAKSRIEAQLQRATLIALKRAGKTNAEIAAATGKKIGAVKVAVHRLRKDGLLEEAA